MTPQNRFIGREKELDALERFHANSKSGFIPIYGRRRVGKSEMILQFLQNKRSVYFLGKKANPLLQIREFLKEASLSLGLPLIENQNISNWKDALNIVVENSGPEKIVLALDEFQWIAHEEPGILSYLQELWDLNWSRGNKLTLILCGSYIGFMERDVLGSQSPLFGRRTGQMLIQPFNYLDSAKFHPDYGHQDSAKTYFICGGIPLYLNLFRCNKSIEQNIKEQFLDEYAPLYAEPNYLLREELREVENFESILFALANKTSRRKELAASTGIDSRALDYYLRSLLGLGYIEKMSPLSPAASKKHPLYRLKDPLLRFWFRFVYPNESYLRQFGPEKTFKERISSHLPAYYGICFEDLCRKALPNLLAREGVEVGCKLGSYWDQNIQLDIIALRDDQFVEIGECKWQSKSDSANTIEKQMVQKIAHYPNPEQQTIRMHYFSKSAMSSTPNLIVHNLKELYSL
ncbi:MAG: ATP-binding protein [Planctomycetes bacterium]|nr:ATP-binding protein [Planctomycetota bacterium]